MNILVPGTEATRSYSFSSGPEVESASFLVKITPGGLMSEYLSQRAQVGDTLELTGPMGSFFLRSGQRRALLLAGGTGLAPLLSILEKMRTESSTRPVHLVYGVQIRHRSRPNSTHCTTTRSLYPSSPSTTAYPIPTAQHRTRAMSPA